jgi:GT2 family glycosyltransferase
VAEPEAAGASSSAPTPEISVIVPVRNGARSLAALLQSLDRQTLARDRFEVIVVANGSADASPQIAAAHGARVLQEPIANRSQARNRGVQAARSRLYAFTDADCVASPRWLEALLACRNAGSVVAGAVELGVSDSPNAIERFERLWRFGQEAWVLQGWAATANLLVHREAFEAVGGFETAYRHGGEDADFCLRAGAAGHTLAYCPGAVVRHPGERALGPFLARFFRHGHGSSQVFYRLGQGYRAWRDPVPAVWGDRALRQIGHAPDRFPPQEWQTMVRLARVGYVVRIVGSLWAEVDRLRDRAAAG